MWKGHYLTWFHLVLCTPQGFELQQTNVEEVGYGDLCDTMNKSTNGSDIFNVLDVATERVAWFFSLVSNFWIRAIMENKSLALLYIQCLPVCFFKCVSIDQNYMKYHILCASGFWNLITPQKIHKSGWLI